jgi:hypothetical protein
MQRNPLKMLESSDSVRPFATLIKMGQEGPNYLIGLTFSATLS